MNRIKISIFTLISFLLLATTVFASYGTEHVAKGELTGGAVAKYWTSGTSTYGFESHIDHAMANWNVRSSNVELTQTSNDSDADIKLYVGYNNLQTITDDTTLGETDYWDYTWYGSVEQIMPYDKNTGTNFDKARIRYDKEVFDRLGFTTFAYAVKVIGHEIGHALSLEHFEDGIKHNVNSWMYSSKTESLYPYPDDTAHLQYKWGE